MVDVCVKFIVVVVFVVVTFFGVVVESFLKFLISRISLFFLFDF